MQREPELDSLRTVASLFTLALGRKWDGEGEDAGEFFVGEAGLDLGLGLACLRSTLAVTCIERSTRRQGMESRVAEVTHFSERDVHRSGQDA